MKVLQQTILLLLLSSFYSADSQELQRLFMTPAERQQLNYERDNPPGPTTPPGPELPVDEPVLPEPPPQITVNGVIKREHSHSTVWINDNPQPVEKLSSQEGFSVDFNNIKNSGIPISITKNGQTLTLKPGQTYDTTENKISERFSLTTTLDKTQESY